MFCIGYRFRRFGLVSIVFLLWRHH